MSALPPKADMCSAARDFRFGPIADIEDFGLHNEKTQDIAWALSNVKVSNYSCRIKQ
jgi:hypothetical protein